MPEQVRQGLWRDGGTSDYLFFRQGDDVVVTKSDGSFVTILQGGAGNSWFLGAKSR